MIELSVGLPMFRSKDIAFVAFESLCNQKGIDFGWELLIMEESGEDCFGQSEVQKYAKRLGDVGCKRIAYKELDDWVPLSFKWKFLGQQSSETRCFLLQAADCYSQPYRLKETHDLFKSSPETDWVQSPLGYFYHVVPDKMVLFNKDHPLYDHRCALNMAIRTTLVKDLPPEFIPSGVDSWLFRTCEKMKGQPLSVQSNESDNWKLGVDVHGFNKISRDRGSMIMNIDPPFEASERALEGLVPDYIAQFIRDLKIKAGNNKTIYDLGE